MYKEQLIKALSKVLNDEISASIVYKAMAEYSVLPQLEEQLLEHSKDEFEHFNEIFSFCVSHGISPEVKLMDYVNNYPSNDTDILMFTQKLEKEAIEDYKSIVLLARENDDVETESFFTEIMNDEIEHFDDLAPLNKKEFRELNPPRTSFSDYVRSN